MPSMTLDQLKYALAVKKSGSFSKAAEACHISQPSLSIQIARLEEELGVQLFFRHRTGVQLTEYGESILAQAQIALNQVDRITDLSHELKGTVAGDFRLGIIPTLAPSLLPLFVGRFGKRYPNVRLKVVEEPTTHLLQSIRNGTLDAAILSTPQQSPDKIIERVLFYEPFVVFASTQHPILKFQAVSPSQISASEIYLLDEAHCMRDQVLQLCKLKQGSPDNRLQIQSGSLQTLIELIRRENGYTLLPILSERFLSHSERAKSVVPFIKPTPTRKVSLVYHEARLKRSITEAMRTEIIESLPETVQSIAGLRQVKVLSPSDRYFEI